MADNEFVVGVKINAKKWQIEVTTMQRGKGRHRHYQNLTQMPPELQSEALELIRRSLQQAGYETMSAVDEALSAELVTPTDDGESGAEKKPKGRAKASPTE